MTSKLSALAVVAVAAIFSIPSASNAAARQHRGAPYSETGYTNPDGCLGGDCTGRNPDRGVRPSDLGGPDFQLQGRFYRRHNSHKARTASK
jgi:hypothetical protein